MQKVIGLTPNITAEGVLDENINIAENMIIPLVMDIDKSMLDVDKVK